LWRSINGAERVGLGKSDSNVGHTLLPSIQLRLCLNEYHHKVIQRTPQPFVDRKQRVPARQRSPVDLVDWEIWTDCGKKGPPDFRPGAPTGERST
jgi:hypothetical protein